MYSTHLLILGVQKAGTTTLFEGLGRSPNFVGALKKEIHFFDCFEHYKLGQNWYLQHFNNCADKFSFEASPSYIYSKMAPLRIRNTLDSPKFVVILRDPVERCYSAWNMYRTFNQDQDLAVTIYKNFIEFMDEYERKELANLLFSEDFPSFYECIEKDIHAHNSEADCQEPSFVRRGLYYQQIQHYLEYFKISDFLFIEQSELDESLGAVIRKVECFLGIDPERYSNIDLKLNRNKGEYEVAGCTDNRESINMLRIFYSEHNLKLFDLIQKTYRWNVT
jgi:hypothetical protein